MRTLVIKSCQRSNHANKNWWKNVEMLYQIIIVTLLFTINGILVLVFGKPLERLCSIIFFKWCNTLTYIFPFTFLTANVIYSNQLKLISWLTDILYEFLECSYTLPVRNLRLTNVNTMQKLFTKMKFKVILKFLKVCSFSKKPEMVHTFTCLT